MQKEYGGYLPFEIQIKDDYFSKYGEEHILRTNSAKAAIYHALNNMKIRKLYAPYYCCASVNDMIDKMDFQVQRFYVDENLLPILGEIEDDAALLIVNYFGIMGDAVRRFAEKYKNVLIDHAHAYFEEPVFREGVSNVYSCRKFAGVPDGGYLVAEELPKITLEEDKLSDHFSYLVKSLEYGTNAAYEEKKASDLYFRDHYIGMSRLSRGMLSAIDYEKLIGSRKENFARLHDLLGKHNRLKLSDKVTPAYFYPFWPEKSLKQKLVAEKIYVPTMWRELIRPEFEGKIEYQLSDEGVFLPIDQRYGAEDMDYIAGRVLALLEE